MTDVTTAQLTKQRLDTMTPDLAHLCGEFLALAAVSDMRGNVTGSYVFRHMAKEIGLILGQGVGLVDELLDAEGSIA